ncbi:hypothetical protein P152DRAFT_255822 [Eremomyces bilateralis CBS 781.70]|uniref:Uncharacterized protein n=1 Tax=Eremomyces bilateralis CBS 781.70 TaxID=1392243 RepID=A0A6G1FQW1_9PEZI|nr:uncharacterized protein P152DRAFT_255822 [Eremomyces bilateralis CBS 781.70]KAF1808118.1 hypothetical protein P152DRAFT_255822 [Eremomyces bilateralis CBS 781.70]
MHAIKLTGPGTGWKYACAVSRESGNALGRLFGLVRVQLRLDSPLLPRSCPHDESDHDDNQCPHSAADDSAYESCGGLWWTNDDMGGIGGTRSSLSTIAVSNLRVSRESSWVLPRLEFRWSGRDLRVGRHQCRRGGETRYILLVPGYDVAPIIHDLRRLNPRGRGNKARASHHHHHIGCSLHGRRTAEIVVRPGSACEASVLISSTSIAARRIRPTVGSSMRLYKSEMRNYRYT